MTVLNGKLIELVVLYMYKHCVGKFDQSLT